MKNEQPAVLITGGAGFIGSHLTDRLLTQNEKQIVVLDDLSSGSESNLTPHPRLKFIRGSVTDIALLDEVFRTHSFESVVHLAAIASVQECLKRPEYSHEVNCASTISLLERCRVQSEPAGFIFASSAAVYGNQPENPKSESSPALPESSYGIDKYCAERYVLSYHNLYGLNSFAFRFFNVYGARQNPASPYSGVLSIFADRFIHQLHPEITVYGDGSQTRDFVSVEDVVQALLLALDRSLHPGYAYNVATGNSVSLNQIIGILSELSGKTPQIKQEQSRPGDIRDSRADISRISQQGFAPVLDIRHGLSQYLEYLAQKP